MKKWKRISSIFLIAMILCTLTASNIYADEKGEKDPQQVLTVAFPETKGLQEVNEDGTYGGLVYDWLMEIAKYTGWKYEFVTGDVETMLSGMMEGKYDLMGGMFYQKEYESFFEYPKYAVGSSYCLLISRENDPEVKSFDISTLNGKTIGVFQNAKSKIERLKVFLESNQLNCKIKKYKDVKAYESCLDNGEADLMLSSDANLENLDAAYDVCAKFTAESYYIVTKAGSSEICSELSQAIEKIYEADPNMALELYDKYVSNTYTNSIHFSESDRNYIKESGTVRVAIIKEGYPLTYRQNKTLKGIVPDVLNLIQKQTGLKFEYVYANSYSDALGKIKDGKADIMGSYLNDAYQADIQQVVLTKKYAQLNTVIIRNRQSELSDKNLTIAVPEDMAVPNGEQNHKVAFYPTFADCLKAIDAGDADYMEIPSALLESLFTSNYYANVTPSAAGNEQMQISMALSSDFDVNLYSILNKAINSLSKKEIEGIIQQNLISSQISKPNLKAMLYSHIGAVIVFLIAFIILLVLVFFTIGRLSLKSKAMALKLEKAEEMAKAKSDFLSRMSHEIRTPMNAIIGLTSLTKKMDGTPEDVGSNLNKIDTSAKFLLSLVNDILDMSKLQSDKMVIQSEPFSLNKLIRQIEDIFTLQAEEKSLELSFSKAWSKDGFIGDETRLAQVLVNLLSNACKFTPEGGTIQCSVEEKSRNQTHASLEFRVKDTGIGIHEDDLERIFGSFEQLNQNEYRVQGTGLGLAISSNLVRLMGGALEVSSRPGTGSDFFFTLDLPLADDIQTGCKNTNHMKSGKRLSEMHFLLAEDNDLNAEIAISLLELEGAQVDWASDGQKAVEMFKDSRQGYYQAILMDVQMPIMNGLDASFEIRRLNRKDAKKVAIIAMTANSFREDREKALAAGMDRFIAKPFEADQLIETLLACTTEGTE
ncbi:transporter substrate-binding domain-containing protein [Eubacteriales bacterium DFI.9.88]|nr:transporter substrate-binding domain-containing protein [Eubacteriales bacterium DFI.9.88]